MTQQFLSVLWVRDGRPGHEKQSLGLIESLRERYTVLIQEVRVSQGGRALQAMALLWGTLPQQLVGFSPDVIIGTGSHTHVPILALRKRLGGHTVVCMSPMTVVRSCFDLCCVPRHDGIAEGKNILLTDGPPGVNRDLGQHDPNAALVLVGGVDEKSHVWDSEAISKEIAAKIKQHSTLHWTLTTSPRTPADFLEVFARYQPQDVSLTIAPFSETPPGWLEKQLQKNNWALVTEDSVSMIFEALSAGCRVVTISIAFVAENKFVACLEDLKKRGLVSAAMSKTVNRQQFAFNEANRCVEYIIHQPWWPLK
nr:ELM1/GtrOC1 family putative glycosyltransferase [uncultured Desulfobulbus sp.]